MLPDASNSKHYNTDGETVSFPITFEFSTDDTIRAWIRNIATKAQSELVNPDDFSIDGKNLILVDVWDIGYKLLIMRAEPQEQTLYLEEEGEMPSKLLERRLDKLIMVVQDLRGKLKRALLLPETASQENLVFPEPKDDHFLEWQSGVLQNTQHISGTVTCTEFAETLLDDPDKETAQSTLDVAPTSKGVTNGDNHDHVGGDGAQIDHGEQGGLEDDDHTQYHNNARGDARYLYRENTGIFTPDGDYEPATKKYVDDEKTLLDARIKAWIHFNGVGTIAIQDSFNISSIVDNGVGNYTVNWDIDFLDAKHAILLSTLTIVNKLDAISAVNTRVRTYDNVFNPEDSLYVCLMAIGDQ